MIGVVIVLLVVDTFDVYHRQPISWQVELHGLDRSLITLENGDKHQSSKEK